MVSLPILERVLAYETISETEFGLDTRYSFSPNVFVDIFKVLTLRSRLWRFTHLKYTRSPSP